MKSDIGRLLKAVNAAALISFLTQFSSAAPAPESRFVGLDGAKVHYTNYGAGENAVLFVHGWACDETFWSAQAPALGEKFHVITIDLPGHGQSDKPKIQYTMDLCARAIEAVLNDAKAKAATLVGHSNGAPVIRQFYRKFPAKTRGLVIVDGALRPFGDRATMEKFIAPLRGPNYAESAGKFIDGITRPIKDGPTRDKIKTAMLRTPQDVAVSEFEATLDPELWLPDKINVPLLMILAKQPGWTAEDERFAHELAADLDYQMWEGVSHFIMMDKPAEFNAALIAFLEKKQGGAVSKPPAVATPPR